MLVSGRVESLEKTKAQEILSRPKVTMGGLEVWRVIFRKSLYTP